MPCATGKILAQAPLRRFERKLVALRYERRSSIEHVRPAARGCSASTTMQELLELSNRGCSRSEVRWSKVSTVVIGDPLWAEFAAAVRGRSQIQMIDNDVIR